MFFFFFQAEDGIRDADVTGVQTCALPISFGAQRTFVVRAARVAFDVDDAAALHLDQRRASDRAERTDGRHRLRLSDAQLLRLPRPRAPRGTTPASERRRRGPGSGRCARAGAPAPRIGNGPPK